MFSLKYSLSLQIVTVSDRSGLAGCAVIAVHTLLSLGNKLISGKQKKCYDRSSADSLLKVVLVGFFLIYFHSQIRKS